jgi:cell division protein FtsN
MTEKPQPSKREYPAVYEKAVPIAIGVLIAIVIALLLFTVLVGIGVLNFG